MTKKFITSRDNKKVVIRLDDKKYNLGYSSINKRDNFFLYNKEQYIFSFNFNDLNFLIQKNENEFLIDLKNEKTNVFKHIKVLEKGYEVLYKCNHDNLDIDYENEEIEKIYKILKK